MTINIEINQPDDGDRFNELVSLVPKGSFYDPIGDTIPYRNIPTNFTLDTTFNNQRFAIFVNGFFAIGAIEKHGNEKSPIFSGGNSSFI